MEICPHYFYLYVVWMFSLFNIFKGMDCKDQVHHYAVLSRGFNESQLPVVYLHLQDILVLSVNPLTSTSNLPFSILSTIQFL